jgi:hypothetical protein
MRNNDDTSKTKDGKRRTREKDEERTSARRGGSNDMYCHLGPRYVFLLFFH